MESLGGAVIGSQPKPKIGLIVSTLMTDEYNDFTSTRPAAVEKLRLLEAVMGEMGEVVCLGLTETMEDGRSACKEFEKCQTDVIVYTALSYNKGTVAAEALLKNDIPVLVWNTQHARALPDEAGWDETWTNSGLAGIPELCNMLVRAGRSFHFLTGDTQDVCVRQKIRDYVQVAWLRSRLRNCRIATIGQMYPGMTDFMVDTFDLYRTLGPVCLPIDPGLIAEALAEVRKNDVDSLIDDTVQRYQVRIDDQQTLIRSASLALAMEKVVCNGSNANAVACLDQIWLNDPRVGIPPTFAYLYLYANGIPCANEVDVATCVALLILQFLSGRSAIAEFLDMDFESDSVTLCHDSNGNPAMAARESDVVLMEAPLYAGVYGKGVVSDFVYPEGKITLLSVATVATGWRMVVAEGESLQTPGRPIGAPFLKFRAEQKTLAEFCEGWCKAGGTHHMAFAYGSWAGTAKMLAELLGVDCAEV